MKKFLSMVLLLSVTMARGACKKGSPTQHRQKRSPPIRRGTLVSSFQYFMHFLCKRVRAERLLDEFDPLIQHATVCDDINSIS